VQTITVVNTAGVSREKLRRVERAVQRQVEIVRRWWQVPRVRFGPGGWPVTLVRSTPTVCGEDAGGCHSATATVDGALVPWAIVTTSTKISGSPWATPFDHEIIEMLTNPDTLLFDGGAVEVCDITQGWNYLNKGVWLADFALPKAYVPGSRGMTDYMHQVSAKDVRSQFAFDGLSLPVPISPTVG
jgi:hypothetical protein